MPMYLPALSLAIATRCTYHHTSILPKRRQIVRIPASFLPVWEDYY